MSAAQGYLGKACREIVVDHHGNPLQAPEMSGAPLCLRLAPGLVLMRRVEAPELGHKELLANLRLYAEESLPDDPEGYFLESWSDTPGTALLAALPKQLLARLRERLGKQRPLRLRQLIVPEFMVPGQGGNGLVLWATPGGLTACCWNGDALQDCHSFPRNLAPGTLLELVDSAVPEAPQWVALDPNLVTAEQLDKALGRRWPQARRLVAPQQAADGDDWHYAGPDFSGFLREEELRPADVEQKWRLGLMLTGALCAGLFFLYAEVRYLEYQVERENHQTSLLKVQANRSGQLATRVGALLQELDELRAMTVEREGVLMLLHDLSDALPSTIRLEAISLERGGGLTLEGLAPSENDISHFMRRLGESRNLNPPNLTFAQKASQSRGSDQSIRFRLELSARETLLRLPENPDEV